MRKYSDAEAHVDNQALVDELSVYVWEEGALPPILVYRLKEAHEFFNMCSLEMSYEFARVCPTSSQLCNGTAAGCASSECPFFAAF
jgi:hypothetical protein